ncbi:glycosyl hydrolase family 45 [Diplocarpon rosae]|nr:glycosyl hydrolase family 45 [Diplocarpon rosae]
MLTRDSVCSNQTPWAVSDTLAYGFVATTIAGGTEASWCCACYELTFTSGPVAGKQMVVQATNTGGDLGSNQFDIAVGFRLLKTRNDAETDGSQIPGGGFGSFNGCTAEWGTPSTGWGAQYGGITTRSQCDALPAKLRAGCYWRFDWFQNADNPAATFQQVACPAALTARSGCVRADDAIDEAPTGTSGSSAAASTPSTSASWTVMTVPTVSASSSGAGVAKYGQCGGSGYAGSTQCVVGSTCIFDNDYYSQCL